MLHIGGPMQNYFCYEYSRDIRKRPVCWKAENNTCGAHFHSSIEFVYVTSGETKAILNGQVFYVKKNQFLIVPSYAIHTYTAEQHSSSYVLTVPLDAIPSYKSVLSKKTFAYLLVEEPSLNKELKHCLDAICSLSSDTDSLNQFNIVKGYTYVFLGFLINHVGLVDISSSKILPLAQDILIYLQNNYLQPLSLEEIAEHFGYSKSRFSHIFNSYFGCALVNYINGLRCRYALELMKEKNNTITEIALASGFESTRTFYRAFKKCFGSTPTGYDENSNCMPFE